MDEDAAEAIARGAAFLMAQQDELGAFETPAGHFSVGISAIAGLALVSLEDDLSDPALSECVELCQRFFADIQEENGYLAPGDHGSMYEHAFAAMFLAECVRTHPHDMSAIEPTDRAVSLIVESQHANGSWHYQPGSTTRGDSTATACQLVALTWAERAGLEVPDETVAAATEYLLSCQNDDGGFSYMGPPTLNASGMARTANVLAALRLVAGIDDDAVMAADDYFDSHRDALLLNSGSHVHYGRFFAAQAAIQRNADEDSDDWYQKMVDELIEDQNEDGSWVSISWGHEGNVYNTSLALYILQLPYAVSDNTE